MQVEKHDNGGSRAHDRQAILDLIDDNGLTVHFQPIFSSVDGSVYGYEALTRIKQYSPFASISELFQKAKQTEIISNLDVRCRENAIRQAVARGIRDRNAYLFINICPETLVDRAHRDGLTDEYVDRWGFQKEHIILEITEESAIDKFTIFKKAVDYYRRKGYKIAIDDFGAGYGGMKMLSIIEPDYVKIDRHFISNIDKANTKYNLVECIATACHRLGIRVIAEGIERAEELDTVINMDIEMLQGFYLKEPYPTLNGDRLSMPLPPRRRIAARCGQDNHCDVGAIARKVAPTHPEASVLDTFSRFIKNPDLRSLPVVEGERIVGMLHRSRFLENHILGKYGYGFALNQYKTVGLLMERHFLLIEANAGLEEAAQKLQSRASGFRHEDICVTKNGKYYGTLSVTVLLDALTEKTLVLAKGSNPLTGLPGNEFIQREIDRKLSQGMHFDVCYIDIDNFKPYNDHYGFEKGDHVIKTLAHIISDAVEIDGNDFDFVGHIGGDDFIVITRPKHSVSACNTIIAGFETLLPEFHNASDCTQRFYISHNRKGEQETFRLLSLSIGIVSTEFCKIESYAQLASIATEVKMAAKAREGSVIIRDRRFMGMPSRELRGEAEKS
jgi:diguanylate cyclase (GGDEF)-like protein